MVGGRKEKQATIPSIDFWASQSGPSHEGSDGPSLGPGWRFSEQGAKTAHYFEGTRRRKPGQIACCLTASQRARKHMGPMPGSGRAVSLQGNFE
jgi:hypothetical protein